MKIEVFTIAWNEEKTINQFIDWYSFADKITIFDNHSTDQTRAIAKERGCDVFLYGPDQQDNRRMLEVKERCWRGCSADWVIVCDMDEFIYHPRLPALLEKTTATVIECAGYVMVSEDELPRTELKMGARVKPDKSICFKPSKVKAMNWIHGCHLAYPEGEIKVMENTVKMLHYSLNGRAATKERWREYKNRMSAWDIERGAGLHYTWGEEKIDLEFDTHLKNITKVW